MRRPDGRWFREQGRAKLPGDPRNGLSEEYQTWPLLPIATVPGRRQFPLHAGVQQGLGIVGPTPRPGEASITLAFRHGRVDNLLKAHNWCPPDIRARLGDCLSHERLRVRRMRTGISFTVPRTHRKRLADQRSQFATEARLARGETILLSACASAP